MANIIGTNSADLLIGTDEADLIEGLGGDDELAGGPGNDTLDGGAGFDIIALWRDNSTIGARIDMGAGRIVGDPINTGTDAFRNVEMIVGTRYDDFYDASTFGLVAGNANYGSAGLLNIIMPLRGSDVIIGNGNTALFFNDSGATSGVTVDLSQGYAYGSYHGNKVILGALTMSGAQALQTTSNWVTQLAIGLKSREHLLATTPLMVVLAMTVLNINVTTFPRAV